MRLLKVPTDHGGDGYVNLDELKAIMPCEPEKSILDLGDNTLIHCPLSPDEVARLIEGAGSQEFQWFDVNDRLPEYDPLGWPAHSHEVLVASEHGMQAVGVWGVNKSCIHDPYWKNDDDNEIHNVTHWAELPNAPRRHSHRT